MTLTDKEIILGTQLESIYIENHPDRRASGWDMRKLIEWGVSRGLITQKEAEEAKQ